MFDLFGGLLPGTVDRPDGTRLALLTSEATEPKGCVLAVHGFTGAKEDFLFLLPELSAKGWSATAVDLRGVHQSTSSGPYDLDTLASDLVAVARSLREPVHLVAHSFGGLAAQRAVIADPAAFASLTLVCSGPAGFMASADLVPVTIDRVTMFARELEGHDLAEAWDAKTAYENVDMHPAMASFLRERFVAGSHEAALQNASGALGVSPPSEPQPTASAADPTRTATTSRNDGEAERRQPSTSPSSTRTPRTFTWSSIRPR